MTESIADEDESNLDHRQILLVISTLIAGNLIATLNTTLVSLALPTIVVDLNGIGSISWVVTAYLLAATAVTPLYGKFSDMFGRKVTYQVSVVIFAVGSLLCALAQSMGLLIVARVVQGLGGGGLLVGAFAILGEVVSARERGRYLPYLQGVNATGVVAGPALGGLLIAHASWRWVFLIDVIFAVLGLVVISIVLKLPSKPIRRSIDLLGSALLMIGVVSLLLAVVWGGKDYPWDSSTILGLALLGLLLFGLFVIQEHRAPEPLVPLDLLRNGVVRASSVFVFLFAVGTIGATIIVFQQYAQVVLGYDPASVWRLLLPFAVLTLLTGIAVGRIISRTGRYKIFPIVGSLIGIMSMGIFARLGVDSPSWVFACATGVLGIALGSAQQVPLIAAQNAVPREQLGSATGMTQFAQQLGTAVGAALFGTMFSSHLARVAEAGVKDGIPRRVFLAGREAIRTLPSAQRRGALSAYADVIANGYPYAVGVLALALLVALTLKERPLQKSSFAGRDQAEVAKTSPLEAKTIMLAEDL